MDIHAFIDAFLGEHPDAYLKANGGARPLRDVQAVCGDEMMMSGNGGAFPNSHAVRSPREGLEFSSHFLSKSLLTRMLRLLGNLYSTMQVECLSLTIIKKLVIGRERSMHSR